jgi:hypothetical protein
MKKLKEIKPNNCECNFRPPHPMRVEKGHVAQFNGKEYPEEFWCDFCKGLIVNDIDYIKEVIRMLAYKRWATIKWNPHRNKDDEIFEGEKIFLNIYKSLI